MTYFLFSMETRLLTQGNITDLVYLDFRKAFPKVFHKIILENM